MKWCLETLFRMSLGISSNALSHSGMKREPVRLAPAGVHGSRRAAFCTSAPTASPAPG
jgi:hypothetical protein